MKINDSMLWAAALAAALLAGCGKKSGGDPSPVELRITSAIDAMTTRAAGTMWAAGDRIGVTATKADGTVLFTNEPYVTASGDGAFAPEGRAFAFPDRDEVIFTAYYPYTGEAGMQPGSGGVIEKTIASDDQTPARQEKIDYLFAQAAGSAARPDVRFRFRHSMSRMVLRFVPGEGVETLEDIRCEVSGLKLGGRFRVATGAAEAEGGAEGSVAVTVPYDAGGMSSSLFLFPQRGNELITLEVQMRGKPYFSTFRLPENENGSARELLPGCSYTFEVKVHSTQITVTPVSVEAWDDYGRENIVTFF